MTTHHESFTPPYQFDSGYYCPDCTDEFFCSFHDEDGPHEQGGDPPTRRPNTMTTPTPLPLEKERYLRFTKEMHALANPLDFVPLLGRSYRDHVIGMEPAAKLEFDTWQLEQDNRKRLAQCREAEIRLMFSALADHEKKGGGPNESNLVLHFFHGWSRAGGDGLRNFSRMFDSALDTAGITDYCLECMKRECECVTCGGSRQIEWEESFTDVGTERIKLDAETIKAVIKARDAKNTHE